MIRGWTVRFISLVLLVIMTQGSPTSTRHRRNIMDFSEMVKATTSKSGLIFLDYGSYCGYGGSGNPNDPIDECCLMHDRCYRLMKNTGGCRTFTTKYTWYMTSDGPQCGDSLDYCSNGMCECDRQTALCFANNLQHHTPFAHNYLGGVVNDIQQFFRRLF